MAHFIAHETCLEILGGPTLPAELGGGPNPFTALVGAMNITRGPWWHHHEVPRAELVKRGYNKQPGINMFRGVAARQYGVPAPPGPVYMSPFFAYEKFPLASLPAAFGLFAAVGVYFELIDYEVFITIPDSAYDDAVPAYLPGSTATDEDGDPVATTWRNWRAANNTHRAVGTDNHIPLSSMTGAWLAGSLVVQLLAGGGTIGQFKDYPE